MTRIVLHIRDTISLEALRHSVSVQERMPLTSDWWLMMLCPAFSAPCDLAFPSFLFSLPRCVVEGMTVSRKTSLSNFKRAQFPSKTCWRGSSRAQRVYLCRFLFIFYLLFNIVMTVLGTWGRHQHEIWGHRVCVLLSIIFTKGTWTELYTRLW